VSSTVRTLLGEAVGVLAEAGLPTARQDAEWLLADLLGIERWSLSLEPEHPVPPAVGERFARLLARRRRGEPLQHLLGWEEFCGLRLRVSPAALIPRPETELLVAWTLELLRGSRVAERPGLAIDLGTGNGAIACALAHALPSLSVVGVDISAEALALARENIRALGLDGRIRLVRGDLFGPLARVPADVVLANPPYIVSADLGTLPPEVREYEPHVALDGGPDGTAFHRRILTEAPRYLRSGGWLLMEIGEGQAKVLASALALTDAFEAIEVRRDLQGRDRMIGARRR
jgi:release factor glutamine methyltransferase